MMNDHIELEEDFDPYVDRQEVQHIPRPIFLLYGY